MADHEEPFNRPESTSSIIERIEIKPKHDGRSSNGGVRPGSGRKKGKLDQVTLSRIEAQKQFKDRVAKNVDRLFNAQINKALGETYLMVKRKVGKGASARTVTEIVDSPEVIKQYLDGELDDTDDEWYYMSTKAADNFAIQNLLDRSFGKANETIENTGEQTLTIKHTRG